MIYTNDNNNGIDKNDVDKNDNNNGIDTIDNNNEVDNNNGIDTVDNNNGVDNIIIDFIDSNDIINIEVINSETVIIDVI